MAVVQPPARQVAAAKAAAQGIRRIRTVTGDIEIDGHKVHLTNLDKPIWPDIPKREFIAYYVGVGPWLLPHLKDRALGCQIFPDGINGKSFWRKQLPTHAPVWLRHWEYSGEDKTTNYIVADSLASLAWLANSGAIDLHPWHSRIDAPDKPDWAVFDLDPAEGAKFDDVVAIARLVKVALDHLGMHGYLKTSGQTGLQIYVPLRRGPSYAEVRAWVEGIGRAIGRVVPELVSWEWTVSLRTGRVRIDYTQNVLNKTLAAPYALRPLDGAPVSTPLDWSELSGRNLRPNGWNHATIQRRLTKLGDLFAPVLAGDQNLPGRELVEIKKG